MNVTRVVQGIVATVGVLLVDLVSAQGYGERQDWTSYWNGWLNISVYVFRDANRNGVFDLADRPLVGIEVEALGNDFRKLVTSNMSGFANFAMSATRNDADITTAGHYEFRTLVPPGWSVSTGNAVQQIDFQLRPGSPADLVAIPAPALVGMMPDLYISGRVETDSDAWIAEGPNGELIDIAPDADGRFSFPATRGIWQIRNAEQRASPIFRSVEVRDAPVVMSAILSKAPIQLLEGHVIGFDDLVSTGVYKVPTGYGGLAWDNFVASHQYVYPAIGYPNTTNSGEFVAYNGSAHPAAIYLDQPFTFVGGYFGAGTDNSEGETLRLIAWRGDKVAYEEEIKLSAISQLYFQADFVNVTRIEFVTDHYWHFVCDELTFVTN